MKGRLVQVLLCARRRRLGAARLGGGLTTTGATSFSAQDVGLTHPDAEFGSVLGG
ncbi:hypothetical protein ACFQV4_34665 [Streptomyces thermocarboxydus]